MEIKFVGPLGKVTGSCTWMRDLEKGWSFLVDCGLQQGEGTSRVWNSGAEWPFEPSRLDFVALTHAHIDHSGLIPLLYLRGFRGRVYCTLETRRLAEVLLRDAARFPDTPFDESDVDLVQWYTHGGSTALGGYHPVANDLFLRYFRSGHIVGAVSITVVWGPKGKQKSIVFSGDVGPGSEDGECASFLRFPMSPKPSDYAVLETTYGDTVRPAEEKCPSLRKDRLIALLDRILETRGTLAIAAFSVGRTQDLMFDIHRIVAGNPERYREIDFLLDSPTACEVNKITLDALRAIQINKASGKVRSLWLGKQFFRGLELDDKNPAHLAHALALCELTLDSECQARSGSGFGNAASKRWGKLFRCVEDRRRLLADKARNPRVVIMGSGTCDGGAAAVWLPELLKSQDSIVALSGFCAPGTIGGQLMTMANASDTDRQLKSGDLCWKGMMGEERARFPLKEIKANVHVLRGYSAHADQSELVDWLFVHHRDHGRQAIGRTVFLQHGEDRQRESLARALERRAADWRLDVAVERPTEKSGWFDLDRGAPALNRDLRRAEIEEQIRRLEERLESV